ncbi:LOW QUALITY PROTEIN: natural resistance-associated macrophage protein 2-like [Pomacea canaliculata]|uniref:LOW QUALITY PROTEIN: natural resistance-associated macrophage protein 2-like n=1 Tax=Pomacea canaliculata TaxID=400727 RepID=UPI000D730B21|nr:LOW QUALITY PROTEIN: natural resistance-associated macrophage protein 2-like [Pomacea canaliculata]
MNLAQVCRQEYTRPPRLVLWLMTEVAIIGSDIQEVIGSAIAINLLSDNKIPLWAGVLITGIDTFTFLFLESAGLRKLEAFFGALITTMAVCFLYIYIKVTPDQLQILEGLWFPWCQDCDRAAIKQLVGIVGAVIMPHNIYLHSALVLVVATDVDHADKGAVREANMYYSVALFISFLVNLFVVAVFAAAFTEPENASLRYAGQWFSDKYGLAMKIMWGLGLLAAGQSSTMTGTYAGQFVMEGFLHLHWAKWKRVLLTRSISIIPTVVVASVTSSRLEDMTQWLNVLQSVQLPFALIPIMHFTSSPRVMGEFHNTLFVRIIVGIVVCLVIGINMYLVALYVPDNASWYIYVCIGLVLAVYMSFLFFLAIGIERFLKLKLWLKRKCGCNTRSVEDEIHRRSQLQYPRLPANVSLHKMDMNDSTS